MEWNKLSLININLIFNYYRNMALLRKQTIFITNKSSHNDKFQAQIIIKKSLVK